MSIDPYAESPYKNSLGTGNGLINIALPDDLIDKIFSIIPPLDLGRLFLTCTHWHRKIYMTHFTQRETLTRYFKFTVTQVETFEIIDTKNINEQEKQQIAHECVEGCKLFNLTKRPKQIFLFHNHIYKGHASITLWGNDQYYNLCLATQVNHTSKDEDAILRKKIFMVFFANLPDDLKHPLHFVVEDPEGRNLLSEESIRMKWDVLYTLPYTSLPQYGIEYHLVKNEGPMKPIGYAKVYGLDRFITALETAEGIRNLAGYLEQYPEDKSIFFVSEFVNHFNKTMDRLQGRHEAEVAQLMNVMKQ